MCRGLTIFLSALFRWIRRMRRSAETLNWSALGFRDHRRVQPGWRWTHRILARPPVKEDAGTTRAARQWNTYVVRSTSPADFLLWLRPARCARLHTAARAFATST